MANPKKAPLRASTPTSAPAPVGASPSPDLSDLAAAMAEEEAEESGDVVTKDDSSIEIDAEPAVIIPAPPAADLVTITSFITPRDVETPLADVSEGGVLLTVVPSEEVEDLKNKVSALLGDLAESRARAESYKASAEQAEAKHLSALAQIEMMDAHLTALDAENKALRNGNTAAPATVSSAPPVKPAHIPADFDLLTWAGQGVYEGQCYRFPDGVGLPRAKGITAGWFPRAMAKKFPHLFAKVS